MKNKRLWRYVLLISVTFSFVIEGVRAEPIGDTISIQHAEEIVQQAYQRVLGRDPDEGGLGHYKDMLLREGHDAAWLHLELRRSQEYRDRIARRSQGGGVALGLVAIWFMLGVGLFVIGDFFSRRILRADTSTFVPFDPFQRLLIGFGVVMCLLQFLTLIFPVNAMVFAGFWWVCIMCLCDAIGIRVLRYRNAFVCGETACVSREDRHVKQWVLWAVYIAVLSAIALLIAGASAMPRIGGYDTYLYHLHSVRWMNTYPAVPGLANLHIRLGTNTIWLLFAAMLNHGPLHGRVAWVMPGFGLWLFIAYLLYVVWSARRRKCFSSIFALLLLPYGLQQITRLSPSLYFDDPAQYLLGVCLVELVRVWESGSSGAQYTNSKKNRSFQGVMIPRVWFVCLITAYLAFLIKPIAAPTAAVVTGAWLFSWFGLIRSKKLVFGDIIMWGSPLLLPLGWVARNAILSGWLLFPAAVIPLPVDWAVPDQSSSVDHIAELQTVHGQRKIIQAWARHPGPQYRQAMGANLQSWFPVWYQARRHRQELRILLPLGGLGIVGGVCMFGVWRDPVFKYVVCFALVPLLQILFWFFSAPDFRFGGGLFWIWMAVGLALPLFLLMRKRRTIVTPYCIAIIVTGLLSGGELLSSISAMKPYSWHIGRASSGSVREIIIDNGQSPALRVWVPRSGDQVGDAMIPATPYPRKSLQARRPGRMRYGFLVDGRE